LGLSLEEIGGLFSLNVNFHYADYGFRIFMLSSTAWVLYRAFIPVWALPKTIAPESGSKAGSRLGCLQSLVKPERFESNLSY
jgi:hypothetical protein